MDNLVKLAKELKCSHEFESLRVFIPRIIENIEIYHAELVDKVGDISVSMDQLTLGDTLIVNKRDIAVTTAKIEIVDKTLSSLNVLCDYLIKKPNLAEWLDKYSRQSPPAVYVTLGESGISYAMLIKMIKSFVERSIQDCIRKLESLDSGYKSPYDFSSITEKLLQSLDNKASVSTNQVQSLLKLTQSELAIIKEAQTMNDGQRALVSIYFDKLNPLESELSSVNKETGHKPKQRTKRLRDIVDGTRLIVKETFELVKALESVDWINESDEIFDTINEKGVDAFDDLIDYMEKIKKEWIEKQIDNETQKVCRLAALRRINVELKRGKKLRSRKTELESPWVILAMKNILTSLNHVDRSSSSVENEAHYLTHKLLPKPRVDVPKGFIRDDVIYDELNASPHHGLVVVFIHIVMYLQQMNTLSWNNFQNRKPRKVADHFSRTIDVIRVSNESCLDDNELHEISFDLADRYLLTKQKIATDRDALEFRDSRFKPENPYKFVELQKKLQSQNGKRYQVSTYMEENFDEMLKGLNRKVVNRGQVIIYNKAIDMMKRSLYTFREMRSDYLRSDERYLIDVLVDQSANEFCYAVEMVRKLLNYFRSNRRIPFSFNADGHFTKQIDLIGLKVKDEFETEVDSTIEKLKLTIKGKEEDLETIKEEKTQLRYLTSILKRSKLIPINELELTEQDELIILKEIIEEYEYTMCIYGPVERIFS